MATKKAATSTSASKKTAAKQTGIGEPKASAKSAAKKTSTSGPEAKPKKGVGKQVTPTHEEISALAYQYWLEGGRHHGSHHHDWQRAEAALKNKG